MFFSRIALIILLLLFSSSSVFFSVFFVSDFSPAVARSWIHPNFGDVAETGPLRPLLHRIAVTGRGPDEEHANRRLDLIASNISAPSADEPDFEHLSERLSDEDLQRRSTTEPVQIWKRLVPPNIMRFSSPSYCCLFTTSAWGARWPRVVTISSQNLEDPCSCVQSYLRAQIYTIESSVADRNLEQLHTAAVADACLIGCETLMISTGLGSYASPTHTNCSLVFDPVIVLSGFSLWALVASNQPTKFIKLFILTWVVLGNIISKLLSCI